MTLLGEELTYHLLENNHMNLQKVRLDLEELSSFIESTIELRPTELPQNQKPTVQRHMSTELDNLRDQYVYLSQTM